jgi:hypothetical protein
METDIDGKANTGNIEPEKFYTKLSLKPNQSHDLNFENTGYYTFNSISILNCGDTKNGIEVSGYGDDLALILGCNSSGFSVNSINIINMSDRKVDLDIFLTGSKTRIKKIRHPSDL